MGYEMRFHCVHGTCSNPLPQTDDLTTSLARLELVWVFVARPSAEDFWSGVGLALLPGSLGKGRGLPLPASVASRPERKLS